MAQPGQSFLERLEAGLGQAGGTAAYPPAQAAPSTAAALLGSAYGAPAAQQPALQANPLAAYGFGLPTAQPAGAAGVADPAAAAQQYQLQLQQYLASMQVAALLQAQMAAMQPRPQ
mmetsp:Transcript_24616/g.44973  ORF Transcript_24616/g.44973 Transcript_24616/m.44973 type:complete len:116 (-) Transcript_24616:37-384(-)